MTELWKIASIFNIRRVLHVIDCPCYLPHIQLRQYICRWPLHYFLLFRMYSMESLQLEEFCWLDIFLSDSEYKDKKFTAYEGYRLHVTL
jgi:hypothetical protein